MEDNIIKLKKTARFAGLLYLILVITGVFSIMFVSSQIIVSGDAVATAKNIIAKEFLFRTGIINDLISNTIFVLLVLVLYKDAKLPIKEICQMFEISKPTLYKCINENKTNP